MAMIFLSSTRHQLSSFSGATLRHLQNLYPLDEFTIEHCLSAHGKHLVYLKQTNLSLHDGPFLDLVVNSDRCVVGIQLFTSKGDVGQGVVLIKKNGALCNVDRDGEVVTVLTDTSNNITRLVVVGVLLVAHQGFLFLVRGVMFVTQN